MALHESNVKPICIIPARGGSRRIPGKNVREMGGRPLISWAIDLAQSSALFDEIIVSTDSKEIAQCARNAGAAVPFTRSTALADDDTGLIDVVADALLRSPSPLPPDQLVCCLLPSAVLLSREDLEGSHQKMASESGQHFLTSSTRYAHPIERAFTVPYDGVAVPHEPDAIIKRTQDCVEFFHDAGQFYWGRVDVWLRALSILADTHVYVLPSSRAVDLDTEEDWVLLEALFKHQGPRR